MRKVKIHSFKECKVSVVVDGKENVPGIPVNIGRGIISIQELNDGVIEERKAIRMGWFKLRDEGDRAELCIVIDKA
jgi:hypothetical protein